MVFEGELSDDLTLEAAVLRNKVRLFVELLRVEGAETIALEHLSVNSIA